jgi:PAS domain S-box-containing protein
MAAFRFGPREAATCVALLSGVAIWATLQGAGPFGRYTEDESLLLLGAFIGTMAVATPLLAALVKELARLAEIVRTSEDGIVAHVGKTPEGIITTWNAGAERLYGYAAHEVIGRPVSILIPPERRDEFSMILKRLAWDEKGNHYETVRVTKDGRRIDVSVTVSPIRNAAGRIVGASASARDITDRNRAEATMRERDALRHVAGLATAAAHEINNPLAVLVGQAQLLERTLDPGERQRVEEILEAATRIANIVFNMNRVTKLDLIDESPSVPEMLDLSKSSEPAGRSAWRDHQDG